MYGTVVPGSCPWAGLRFGAWASVYCGHISSFYLFIYFCFCTRRKKLICNRLQSFLIFSWPEQHPQRAIVLPRTSASVSTNVKVFIKVFKTSLFPNLITDLTHLCYDDTYCSKILRSTIPTTLGHVKVKVTDRIFMLKFYVKVFRISLLLH